MEADTESMPIIVHVPHSAIHIPEDVRKGILLDDDELNRQLLLMTDRFTDEMIDAELTGVTVVHYPVSRLVADPERFRDDEDEIMAKKGMGAVYTHTMDGTRFREFDATEREVLLHSRCPMG
jgi:N-formylglutamate amidohydrolase